MDTRKLVEGIIDAFDRNDVEAILQAMTDDVQWNMLGEYFIDGKEALRKFFADHADVKLVQSSRDYFIVEGNYASVSGEVLCKNEKTGQLYDMYYCDVYEQENGKVKKIVTYNINKK